MMTRRRCCCIGNTTITVTNCTTGLSSGVEPAGIPGFGVRVTRSGNTYFDGVTDASGKANFNLPTPGVSYTITLTGGPSNPRYGIATRSFTPASFPYSGSQAGPPATGYFCGFRGRDPIPNSLFVTFGGDTYEIRYAGTISNYASWSFSWLSPLGFIDTKSSVYPVGTSADGCGATRLVPISLAVRMYNTGNITVFANWFERPTGLNPVGIPYSCPGEYAIGESFGGGNSISASGNSGLIDTGWVFPLAEIGSIATVVGGRDFPPGKDFALSE